MPTFSITLMQERPGDAATSRITDLLIVGSDRLYSTTRFDGQITTWDIAGTGLSALADSDYDSSIIAGNAPWLTTIPTGAEAALLAAGGTGGALTLRDLSGATPAAPVALPITYDTALVDPEVVTFSDGTTRVYAGHSGEGGLIRWDFDATGAFLGRTEIADNGVRATGDVRALTQATVDGTTFLYAASATDLGLTAWQVTSNGTLLNRETLRPADNLRISAPTAMESVTVGGVTYLILAAAGSSSLTVLQPTLSGGFIIVDHVIDDRNTRFGGVAALTTVEVGGDTWVFAGGADDGISAFQVLPGGRMLHRAYIADTTDSTLTNISALAAMTATGGISLFAASATEAGLTRLHLALPDEDEVIIDGAGSDTLTGGTGADIFVFDSDDAIDTITDFVVGEDSVDLSRWEGLRSKSQLFFTPLTNGVTITYGDETLRLLSADGGPIDPNDLAETDLIPQVSLPNTITAGLPGPITAPPTLPERYIPPPGAPPLPAPIDRIEDYGSAAADTITGGPGNDLLFGQSNRDSLIGLDGDDLLFGGPEADRLSGGDGDDQLFGGGGRETRWMTPGTTPPSVEGDTLYGGAGDDLLVGEAGEDHLDGGTGDDIMIGGSGRDTFVFRGGSDVIRDFTLETDMILLDQDLWAGSLAPQDIVARYGSVSETTTVLRFADDDILTIEGVSDLTRLIDLIDYV